MVARRFALRAGIALLTLFVASIVVFAVIHLVPGDPASVLAGSDATPDTVASIRADLGLDRGLVPQYLHWLGQLATGDLGRSYVIGGAVAALTVAALGNTAALAASSLLIAVLIAATLAGAAVLAPNRLVTAIVDGFSALAIAVPTFVSGVVLVQVFAVWLPLLPAGGTPPDGYLSDLGISWQYLLLPAVCLALPVAATLTRFASEALRTEMTRPYVRTARSLGIPERRIVLTGAVRNALPATVTVLGIQTGQVLGSAVLVEAIFAWPGTGQLLGQSVNARDYPVVQTVLMVSVTVFVVVALITDALQLLLDPVARQARR